MAIKVLPEAFSGDPERMARFEREARLLASLSHRSIAAIHGLEEADGKRFIVMELAEGETLARRVCGGPLPVDEALDVCKQIAGGLEAAHEKGIIHRGLKPSNVMVSAEGKVKILDLGLARALAGEVAVADPSHSPSITETMNRPGIVLGTAAYMSPQQARGKPVDKRADVWAFGCILYECLTGSRAFEGDTVTETLAAILKVEPDWTMLPSLPWKVADLLRRCLRKDSKERLHDIADARARAFGTLFLARFAWLLGTLSPSAVTGGRVSRCRQIGGRSRPSQDTPGLDSDRHPLWADCFCLFAYLHPRRDWLLYVGKADYSTVCRRLHADHKTDLFDDIWHRYGIRRVHVLHGELGLEEGRRRSSQLLGDVESLLIKRFQPFENIQSRQFRISRPGLRVYCTGDWPFRRCRFHDVD